MLYQGNPGIKTDFVIYLVKPEPELNLSLTRFMHFPSPQKPEPKSINPESDPSQQCSNPTEPYF
jgi:hypothetical protein